VAALAAAARVLPTTQVAQGRVGKAMMAAMVSATVLMAAAAVAVARVLWAALVGFLRRVTAALVFHLALAVRLCSTAAVARVYLMRQLRLAATAAAEIPV
jgi:hypothetical protein